MTTQMSEVVNIYTGKKIKLSTVQRKKYQTDGKVAGASLQHIDAYWTNPSYFLAVYTPLPPSPRPKIPSRLKQLCWIQTFGEVFGSICRCGKQISVFDFEAGHIVAHAKGGKTIVSNLKPICSTCNKNMSDKNMDEYFEQYFPPK